MVRRSDRAGWTRDPQDVLSRGGELRALWRALGFACSYWRGAGAALLALLAVSAVNLTTPQLIRLAVDGGIAPRRPDVLAVAVAGLVVVALVRGVFSFLQGYLAERVSQSIAYDLRNALFGQIERLSFSYYDRAQTGQLVTRLTSDVEQVRGMLGSSIVHLVSSVVMLLGSVVLLVSLNWRLAIVSLAMTPAILLLLVGFINRIGPLFWHVQATLGRLNTLLQEDLAGTRVVRAFSREREEVRRYREVNDELLATNMATVKLFADNFPFVFLLASLGTLAVVWYGGLETIGGRLTIGELIAFNSYLGLMVFPLLSVGFLASGIARAGASAARVYEILDAPLEVTDAPDAVDLPPIEGRVEFRGVHFRYPGSDRKVLRGVSFAVEPGQTVAILGTTGSGKSTIVNLLPRFYDATGGAVLVDGRDVRAVTLSSLRSQIGIVLQAALLFSGTVRHNIAYGRPSATLEEVQAAARAAQADEFIRTLPQGYDTVVGERGIGLSGGQRQRIAIARALLIDPRLIILDDSTSAVDAETEAAIQAALDALMRDRRHTAFVIAQRISTVRDADLILVLDEGRVAAQGTHEQLLRDSALYNDILGSQLSDDRGLILAAAEAAG